MPDPITLDPLPVDANKLGVDLALPAGGAVPHLSQWFGWWHYEPQRAAAMYDQLRKVDVAAHVRSWKQGPWEEDDDDDRKSPPSRYAVNGGIAVIELSGSLMKHASSMDDGTSTVDARRTVRAMTSDNAVKAAIVVVDSPGGTVSGAYDLADDIKALAAAKPTYGYASDMACSAGYLQLAMCRQISANRTALVGCIGTFGVMYDYSAMFEQDGVKPIVISSGGFKGAGVPGTKITDEQVVEWQREIDALNEAFVLAVMDGRKMSRKQAGVLADGRTHVAAAAKTLGLVDRVESLDDLVARVRREVSGAQSNAPAPVPGGSDNPDGPATKQTNDSPAAADAEADSSEPPVIPPVPNQEAVMAETVKEPEKAIEPRPASIKELRQQFVDDPSFALEAADNAWTMQEAKSHYCDRLQAKGREEKAAQAAAAKEPTDEPSKAPKGGGGVKAVESASKAKATGRVSDGDPVAEFGDAVTAQMAKPGFSDRKKATQAVMRRDPELHRAYLEATNSGRKAKALIADKFDGDE